jgi:hypothetical protein
MESSSAPILLAMMERDTRARIRLLDTLALKWPHFG